MLQTRRGSAGVDTARYRAFLSYSHADEAQAIRLHRALEGYRLPRRLRDPAREIGERPLNPIFRDRSDFAIDADLSAAVVEALSDSAALIVLCSPASAASDWVAQEITLFRQVRPDAPILAVIVGGEPFASDDPNRAAVECFPAPLRIGANNSRREPLAADLRPGKDGERLVALKIVAGILHLRLDDLVQRDAERSQRRLLAITGGALLIAVVLAVSLAFALSARRDAENRREQAEGLVEFMVADLGEKLEPIGRLSLLDAVYSRALSYYRQQDARHLEPDALARRARILQMVGEVRSQQGKFDEAYTYYREAATSTGELLRRFPSQGQRIFDHAQSVFYVGQANWRRGRIAEAQRGFEEYRRLAMELGALDPTNKAWRAELSYAESNLGTLLYGQGRTTEAARAFDKALAVASELATASPKDRELQISLGQAHGWVGDTAAQSGDFARAIAERETEVAIYDRLLADDEDRQIQDLRITAEHSIGVFLIRSGDIHAGLKRSIDAASEAVALSRTDPQNMEWNSLAALTMTSLADARRQAGEIDAAAAAQTIANRRIARLPANAKANRKWERLRIQAELATADIALVKGDHGTAERTAVDARKQIESAMRSTPENAKLRELHQRADTIFLQARAKRPETIKTGEFNNGED